MAGISLPVLSMNFCFVCSSVEAMAYQDDVNTVKRVLKDELVSTDRYLRYLWF
jgi:hypothetical protein